MFGWRILFSYIDCMKITKELIEKVLKLNNEGLTYREIKDGLSLKSMRGIQMYIQKNNIKFVNHSARITISNKLYPSNKNYFSILDTYSKAYILGFTYADGCVYDEKRFGYCISKKDEEILQFIRAEICPSKPFKNIHNTKGVINRSPQIVLRIGNIEIVKDLIEKWGVVKNKTHNCKLVFPIVSKELSWSFIQGLFDGDGWIGTKGGKGLSAGFCMTDFNFLNKLKDFLKGEGVEFRLRSTEGKTCTYYRLLCDKRKECEKFFDKLYSRNQFRLERKFNKYREYRAK